MAFQRPDSRRPRRDGGTERPAHGSNRPRRDDRGAPAGPRTPGRPNGFRPDRDNRDSRPGAFRPNRDERPGGGGRPDRDNRDSRPGGFRPNRDERPGGGFRPDRDREERPRHFGNEGPPTERPARNYGAPSHSADGSVVPHGKPGERNRKFSNSAPRPEGGERRFGPDRPRFDADRPQPRFERGDDRAPRGDNRDNRSFNRDDDRRPGRFGAKANGNRGFGSDRRDAHERHQENRARDERRANTGGWQPEYRFRQENEGRGSDRDRAPRPDRPGDRGSDRFERPGRGGFAAGERGPRPAAPDNRFGGQGRMRQQEAPNYNLQRYEKQPNRKRKSEDDEPKEGIRLNRYIANSGVCSRREADNLIAAGEIRINGEVVTEMGYIVKPNDTVQYGKRSLKREKLVYVLLNKPKDYITTTEDPEERRTVMDLVANASKERIFPVGRLDRNTTGLLLFTNDGEMAQKLTHPSHRMQKIYQVELDKALKPEDFQAIRDGLELEDGKVEVDDLAVVSGNERFVGIELHSGRNRIVRRIFEHLGYDVVTLDRVQYAGLTKKDLPRGNWRYLSQQEVVRLKYFL